jgi:hypothetical protein
MRTGAREAGHRDAEGARGRSAQVQLRGSGGSTIFAHRARRISDLLAGAAGPSQGRVGPFPALAPGPRHPTAHDAVREPDTGRSTGCARRAGAESLARRGGVPRARREGEVRGAQPGRYCFTEMLWRATTPAPAPSRCAPFDRAVRARASPSSIRWERTQRPLRYRSSRAAVSSTPRPPARGRGWRSSAEQRAGGAQRCHRAWARAPRLQNQRRRRYTNLNLIA